MGHSTTPPSPHGATPTTLSLGATCVRKGRTYTQCVHSRPPQQHESVYAQKNKSRNHAGTVLVNPPDGAQSNDTTRKDSGLLCSNTSRHVASLRAGLTLMIYWASVSSCRLRVTETQQLSYVADATPICVEMLRHSRQPITGRLATHADSLCNI